MSLINVAALSVTTDYTPSPRFTPKLRSEIVGVNKKGVNQK
jgi:hypothetical protein